MATRNGKLANLPNVIREQLNLRLLEGETGRELAAWLNALPEVRSVLASQFNGSPISEVNLTLWRQGGYLQWLTERECFDSARALADGDRNLASTGLSAERLLNVLTLRFGELLMRWDLPPDEIVSEAGAFAQMARKARILQSISRSLLAIHRIQSQQSSPSHSHPKSTPLAKAPITAIAPASKTRVSLRDPVAAENCAEPHTNGASDTSPKSADPSSQRPAASSNRVPGLANALSERLRALRGCAGARPEIPSAPIVPSGISSDLSQSPFNPDLNLSEFLAAV
jgi:hypothetical protein